MTHSSVDRAKPDTHEMVVVHRVFRRELALLPELLRATAPADIDRAKVLSAWTSEVLAFLHHHHAGEDELLWPLLLQRARLDAELVHRMEDQHAALDPLIADIDRLTARYVVAADPGDGDQLASTLSVLADALGRHLDEEERAILPLAREYLSVTEWAALSARARNAIPPDRACIVLGAILEDTDDREREEFVGHLPEPVREMWQRVGIGAYDEHVRRVRGVARPRLA